MSVLLLSFVALVLGRARLMNLATPLLVSLGCRLRRFLVCRLVATSLAVNCQPAASIVIYEEAKHLACLVNLRAIRDGIIALPTLPRPADPPASR